MKSNQLTLAVAIALALASSYKAASADAPTAPTAPTVPAQAAPATGNQSSATHPATGLPLDTTHLGQPEPAPEKGSSEAPSQPANPVTLDTAIDSLGVAQQTARDKGLQARIMWIDGGANIGTLNTPAKIKDIVAKIKKAGFNMIVLDVKPIVGSTLYPSKYAPKLTEWRGQHAPSNLDILRLMLDDAHAAGLTLYANMSTFGEGHKFVGKGLGYTHPSWQTTMCLINRTVTAGGRTLPVTNVNKLPADVKSLSIATQTYFDNASHLLSQNKALDDCTVAVLNFDARVVAVATGAALRSHTVTVPRAGFLLIGKGDAGSWVSAHCRVNEIVLLRVDPHFVPIADDNSGQQVYTIFVDPHNPEVRRHELDIVREIVTNYDVDGMVFDDRMRYAGLNAGFGKDSREAFEKEIGHKLTWPDDIFRDSPFPDEARDYGPDCSDWLTWRANNVTSWLKEAAGAIRSIRPHTQVSVYVGSWYGDYYKNGSNWAAANFQGPWDWDSPQYSKTGYAGYLDWMTTGCYYSYPTIASTHGLDGVSPGESVEAGAQLSNRVINDASWIYAGLYAVTYKGHPDVFRQAIAAAQGASQGVMVFDISQIIEYNWWDDIAEAFGTGPVPAAPNTVPGLLETVRSQHAADVAAGKPEPPIPGYEGLEDVGL